MCDVFDVSLGSASLGVPPCLGAPCGWSKRGRHFTLACPWVLNTAVVGIVLAILAGDRANAGPDGKDVPRVAFFGFEFINSSLEPIAQAEVKRIRLLDDALRQKLAASGRFEIVDIPPDMTREITSGPAISNCNGCQRDFAQRVGANWAAWGMVQKVSNLILNINVYMENADSGKMEFAWCVDIRGNTDESWRRGLDYLLRNYLFREP